MAILGATFVNWLFFRHLVTLTVAHLVEQLLPTSEICRVEIYLSAILFLSTNFTNR